jgi:hypothetical protein
LIEAVSQGEYLLSVVLSVSVFLSYTCSYQHGSCKNVGGVPSGSTGGAEDESPPRFTEVARGKRKKTSSKKRKRQLIEAKVAQAVADAADHAEREG